MLLASRSRRHDFVRDRLTEHEVADGLMLAAVLGVASLPLLAALALPLALAGAVAIAYGVTFMWRTQDSEGPLAPGRAFNPAHAFGFALVIAAFIAGSALLVRWLGPRGAILGAGLAGFANVHAGAVSAGALDRADALDERIACIAVLVAFSTNSLTKAGLAAWSGGARFAWRLLPGLVLMVAAAWAGLLL